MTLQYFVIRTIPIHRIEFTVQNALAQREHPAMVPFETKWEKRKNRRVDRKYPVFPCYVFAGFSGYGEFLTARASINQRFEDMGKRPPIVGLIGYGARPANLTPDDVSFLQAMSNPAPTSVNLHKAIRPGARAEIVARGHPFSGHVVTIDSVSKAKARVMLSILGSMKIVEIDASALEAA